MRHLATSEFTLCGRRGTYGTGLALVARFDSRCRRACLCGRRGMWKDPFCVARVAFGDIGLHFVWQVWHLWHWAGSSGALGSRCRRGCLASVALGDIDLHFVRQAWHLRHALALVARLVPVVAAAVCVADVAFGSFDLHSMWQVWHFAWQALHLSHWAGSAAVSQTWHNLKAHLATSEFTLSGRRGTYGTGLALVARFVPVVAAAVCVADVAFGSIDLHSVWQHLATLTFTLCGRRPAYGTGLALVARFVPIVAAPVFVAGVAFGSIHLHSVWHTWHSVTSTFILCGRCGTYGTGLPLVARLVPVVAAAVCVAVEKHTPPFCVASVALGVAGVALMALGWLWWRACFVVAAAVCVADLAFGSIDLHSVWQAWH